MAKLLKVLASSSLTQRVAIVIGTRPGIIKMAPLYWEAQRRGRDVFLIHTGQHYSWELDGQIMADTDLPESLHRVELRAEDTTHARQTGRMMMGVEQLLLELRPKLVLVCGNANTNFAAAVAARKIGVAVGHVEAGLRSADLAMPEEQNRIMIDHIANLLFAPTETARRNLLSEQVSGSIIVTGNTIVDALYGARCKVHNNGVLERLGLQPRAYILVTAHREGTVDYPSSCVRLVNLLVRVREFTGLPLLFPAHPRTRIRLEENRLLARLSSSALLVEPLPYLDFIAVETNARAVLTDSGGLQEEACILGVPCLTIRENTERPETVEAEANVLIGLEFERFAQNYPLLLQRRWPNPFGDGNAAVRIWDAAEAFLDRDRDR